MSLDEESISNDLSFLLGWGKGYNYGLSAFLRVRQIYRAKTSIQHDSPLLLADHTSNKWRS